MTLLLRRLGRRRLADSTAHAAPDGGGCIVWRATLHDDALRVVTRACRRRRHDAGGRQGRACWHHVSGAAVVPPS